jgi:hypothetical protein
MLQVTNLETSIAKGVPSFGIRRRVVWLNFMGVSEERTATIFRVGRKQSTLNMEGKLSSETYVNFYQNTRRHIPKDNYIYHHLENPKYREVP